MDQIDPVRPAAVRHAITLRSHNTLVELEKLERKHSPLTKYIGFKTKSLSK